MTRTRQPLTTRRDQAPDEGFTLIELLVVVVIIGVLIAIAVPMYSNYKKGAQNTAAASDVRGGISAVEQFYTANGNVYPDTVVGTVGNNLPLAIGGAGTLGTITVSGGNTLDYTTHGTYYIICGQSSTGQTIYYYNSSTSKSVATWAGTIAACIA